MHSKNIISGVFTLCFVFCEMYFVFGCAKLFEHYYSFVSFHTNSVIARCKIFGVNAHKEIKVLDFLLIQIQNTCRCRIQWERSLNCITSSIVTTLPEDYLLFIFLCCFFFSVNAILFKWRYIISFIATAAYPGSFAYFLVHIRFAHRSFVVSPRVVSLAFMFVPTIDFVKCF